MRRRWAGAVAGTGAGVVRGLDIGQSSLKLSFRRPAARAALSVFASVAKQSRRRAWHRRSFARLLDRRVAALLAMTGGNPA